MEKKKDEFNAKLPVQIRFNDIDALGHVNNNIYLSFFDLGKVEYLEQLRGASVSWIEGSMVIARLEVDFLSPTFYKEKVRVESRVARLGNKSGDFIQRLVNEQTGEVKCVCKSIFVFIDAETQKPAAIPHVWREAIHRYEGAEV